MAIKSIDMLSTPSELGEFILRTRRRLNTRHSAGGTKLMHAHSDLIDTAISRVFDLAKEEAACELGDIRSDAIEGICLIATGGYGRRELSPFSDIDVTFVVSDEDDPQIDLIVKKAYRLLMDVLLNEASLKIGYSYRQLSDLQGLPLDVHTALLDARCIAGSNALFERFNAAVLRAIVPAAFVLGHIEQRQIVVEKYGSSPYRVEPNIKEGAGGLRDLQTARWIAQITFGASREDVWHTLRSRGIISDQEIKGLNDAAEFLAKVRNALHIVCDRGSDLLTLDRQEEIASKAKFPQDAPALMSRYYMHSERIADVYRKIATACCEQPLEIEPGVVVRRGEVVILDKGLLSRDQEAAMRLFEHTILLQLKLGWETADLIRASMQNLKPPNGCPPRIAMQAFLRILTLPEAGKALEVMAHIGTLQWLIPEFGRIMFQIPGDAAHELTVGAHSLEAARQLESFATGDNDELREIWANIAEPEILFLSALLHDIGKGDGNDSHAESGAVIASSTGQRLGLRPDAVTQLAFLVRNHLVMSEVARLRDLNQKRTVEDFIKIVDSPELLDMLYLLTAADLRSVGQTNWGEVQLRFLKELYHRASTALRGSIHVDIDRHRGRLARELSLANLPQAEVDEHCHAMPASYLLNTPLDDLASHIGYVRQARSGKPVVRLRSDPTGRFTEITVCIVDDAAPGLLAKIAGVMTALDVDIHAAQVFTRKSTDRIAIDLLSVEFDNHTLPEFKKLQVESELTKALSGKTDVDTLLKRFGKKLSGEITLTNLQVMSHLSDKHTVIEAEAEDQPGLLYRMTNAISALQWNIHSARISTWGNKARDAFYVTNHNDLKLDDNTAVDALRQALAVT